MIVLLYLNECIYWMLSMNSDIFLKLKKNSVPVFYVLNSILAS